MKIFQIEKKAAQIKKEEEEKKSKPDNQSKSKSSSMARLLLINFVFFAVVACGLMFVSGHSIFDYLGVAFWAAKSKETKGSNL
jgi:flagellar basal body-associated protein FliL